MSATKRASQHRACTGPNRRSRTAGKRVAETSLQRLARGDSDGDSSTSAPAGSFTAARCAPFNLKKVKVASASVSSSASPPPPPPPPSMAQQMLIEIVSAEFQSYLVDPMNIDQAIAVYNAQPEKIDSSKVYVTGLGAASMIEFWARDADEAVDEAQSRCLFDIIQRTGGLTSEWVNRPSKDEHEYDTVRWDSYGWSPAMRIAAMAPDWAFDALVKSRCVNWNAQSPYDNRDTAATACTTACIFLTDARRPARVGTVIDLMDDVALNAVDAGGATVLSMAVRLGDRLNLTKLLQRAPGVDLWPELRDDQATSLDRALADLKSTGYPTRLPWSACHQMVFAARQRVTRLELNLAAMLRDTQWWFGAHVPPVLVNLVIEYVTMHPPTVAPTATTVSAVDVVTTAVAADGVDRAAVSPIEVD